VLYVRRNTEGLIIAVSEIATEECSEEISRDSDDLGVFFARARSERLDFVRSDIELARVIEDVVELLVSKGLILFTELPQEAQSKLMQRIQRRDKFADSLKLLDTEKNLF